MSIRLRLTLLYSVILAATLILLGTGLYLAVSQDTYNVASSALTTEARSFATSLQPIPNPDQGGALRINHPDAAATSQDFIQVRDLDGTVIFQSRNLQAANLTLPLDGSAQHAVQLGRSIPPFAVSVGGRRFLLYSMPLLFAGLQGGRGGSAPFSGPPPTGTLGPSPSSAHGPIGILQVASPLKTVDQTLSTLRQVLLFGGGIATLLAFGAGWALAGAALRPINRITQTAQEIGAAQDFDRRVTYGGPPDEVGRLASTFNAMLASLQDAYHAQRRFVADASHELRTPLTTIRGNLGLLQRDPPISEADRVAVLADLASESERLSRLVGDLLTLARQDAERPLRQEPVPIGPLLEDLVRRLAVLHPHRFVREEGQPDAIAIGDPDALTQVLLILLDNALKFTPSDGSVTVTTSIHGDHVTIAVRDTGSGIDPDVLPHVFERFYQGDVARAGTGTGLGLAIAKDLVEGQHGTISVESTVGEGSVFTVRLPASAAARRPALARGS